MTHRHYADPLWAPYRNAVAALMCRALQGVAPEALAPDAHGRGPWCWDCWQSSVACRCGAADA